MKREASEHPKLIEFVDALEQLEVPHAKAVAKGVLEGLWHFTARYAPGGDVGRFGDKAIARACGWDGEPEALIGMLVESGWIDREDDHRLVVHDWADHADDAVHRSLARKIERFADGSQPKLTRLGENERTRIEKGYACAPGVRMQGRTVGARDAHQERR
jgi:hypothetical protein